MILKGILVIITIEIIHRNSDNIFKLNNDGNESIKSYDNELRTVIMAIKKRKC